MKPQTLILVLSALALISIPLTAHAADSAKAEAPAAAQPAADAAPAQPTAGPSGDSAERVNVDRIKEKYWARGDESELGVVQNRLYSKERKFELGLFGGLIATDPFISVQAVGGSLGYHFTEYLSLHALGFKDITGPSSALEYLRDGPLHTTANINLPKYFLGLEGKASFLYGKLSLAGKAIIYYDFHFSLGSGYTATENGTYFTPSAGFGQQIYLSRFASLQVDYRLMRYTEHIVERVIPTKLGIDEGTRVNWNNVVTVGITFLMGFGSK